MLRMTTLPTVTLMVALALLAGPLTAQDEKPAPPPLPKGGTFGPTAPIAAWDVVPHQVIDKPFNAGVVSFHETGCKVKFEVKSLGDPATADDDKVIEKYSVTVEKPTLNERVNVWEYWIAIDPKDLPDGPIELHATAIPLGEGHKELSLKPLPMYANAGGTLKLGKTVYVDGDKGDDAGDGSKEKPLKSLKAGVAAAGDGGTIYLLPFKEYSPQGLGGGKKRSYWTVITTAPGVKREEVEIGSGRPGTDKLCFRNVMLFSNPEKRGYNTILAGEMGDTIVWVDDCVMYNRKGRWDGGGNAFGNRYVGYVTGGMTTEMDNGPGGFIRNHKIIKITSDALTGARLAINVEVRDIDPGKTGAHPDWHQSHTGANDKYNSAILYNCSGFQCQSQGFFGQNLKETAFVNCIFHKLPGHALSQYGGHFDHVLWLHCQVPNQTWLWRGSFRADNCYVINGLYNNMSETQGGDASGVRIQSSHFIGGKPMGENATVGDPQFVNSEELNFRVKATSPAAFSGTPLQCVPADIEGKARDAKAPTRGAYVCPEPRAE